MASVLTPQPILYFLQQVLSKPAGALPKGAQWVVLFEDLQGSILPGIKLACSYEPASKNWLIEAANKVLTDKSGPYQEKQGCMFCQGIDLPGEGTAAVVEGNIKSNAFLRSYVGAGREDFSQMRMTFLETNVSFADNFLRGWALSTSNFGMIARSGNKNYRTNLHCFKIGTVAPNLPPFVLMRMTFYDLCCISVSNEEYNYSPVTTPTMREARFIYNHYSVDTETANNEFVLNNNPDLARKATLPNYLTPEDVQGRNATTAENKMAAAATELQNYTLNIPEYEAGKSSPLEAYVAAAKPFDDKATLSLNPSNNVAEKLAEQAEAAKNTTSPILYDAETLKEINAASAQLSQYKYEERKATLPNYITPEDVQGRNIAMAENAAAPKLPSYTFEASKNRSSLTVDEVFSNSQTTPFSLNQSEYVASKIAEQAEQTKNRTSPIGYDTNTLRQYEIYEKRRPEIANYVTSKEAQNALNTKTENASFESQRRLEELTKVVPVQTYNLNELTKNPILQPNVNPIQPITNSSLDKIKETTETMKKEAAQSFIKK